MFGGQQGQPMAQQQNVGQQWGYGQQPNQQQMMAQQNMPGAQQQGYYPPQMGQPSKIKKLFYCAFLSIPLVNLKLFFLNF